MTCLRKCYNLFEKVIICIRKSKVSKEKKRPVSFQLRSQSTTFFLFQNFVKSVCFKFDQSFPLHSMANIAVLLHLLIFRKKNSVCSGIKTVTFNNPFNSSKESVRRSGWGVYIHTMKSHFQIVFFSTKRFYNIVYPVFSGTSQKFSWNLKIRPEYQVLFELFFEKTPPQFENTTPYTEKMDISS